jgi:hypothetical protein
VFTLVCGSALLAACGPSQVTCGNAPPHERTLSTTGTARLDVHPDQARVGFTFSSTARKMSAAHTTTTKKVEDFVAQLAPIGITREDTLYGDLGYRPDYAYPTNAPPRVDTFTASQAIVVKTSDFSKIPAILDAAVASGLTETTGVEFVSTKMPEHKKQVRDMALKATQEKAAQLAEGLGARLGPVKSISESAWDASTSRPSYENAFAANRVAQAWRETPPSTEAPDAPMVPGAIPLTLNLSVVWLLE